MPEKIPYHNPLASFGRTEAEVERSRWYCSRPWRKLRAAYLARHPLCVTCREQGRVEAATTVHHVQERLERPDLALDMANLKGLCAACHASEHNARKARRNTTGPGL